MVASIPASHLLVSFFNDPFTIHLTFSGKYLTIWLNRLVELFGHDGDQGMDAGGPHQPCSIRQGTLCVSKHSSGGAPRKHPSRINEGTGDDEL